MKALRSLSLMVRPLAVLACLGLAGSTRSTTTARRKALDEWLAGKPIIKVMDASECELDTR